MEKPKLLFGVHNEEYNMDFYDDNSISIYDHNNKKEITVFDEELIALFISFLNKDGYIEKLIAIDNERIKNLGMR